MKKSIINYLQNNKILIKYVMSYLLIMILPLLMGSILYARTMSVLKTELREMSLSVLEKGKDSIDHHLTSIDNFIYQLGSNKKIQDFKTIKELFKDGNSYKTYDILQEIFPYSVVNSFVDSYFIYFRKSNSIVMPATFYNYEAFYSNYFNYNNMTSTEFADNILNKNFYKVVLPSKMVTIGKSKEPMVLYLRSFSSENSYTSENDRVRDGFVICVLIKEKEINKVFDNLNMQPGDWMYIEDESGNFITTYPELHSGFNGKKITMNNERGYYTQKINGMEMNMSFARSEINGWTYVTAISNKVVLLKAEYIKNITLEVLFLFSVIGIGLIIYLSYKKSKPFNELIARTKLISGIEIDNKDNEYSLVKSVLDKLLSNNNSLRKSMDDQILLLQAAFYERLIGGKFTDSVALDNAMSQIDIKINGTKYGIAIAKIMQYKHIKAEKSIDLLNLIKILMKEFSDKHFEGSINFYNLDEEKIVLILAPKDGLKYDKQLEEIFKKIFDHFNNLMGVNLRFFIGNFYNSPLEIWRSFNEAKELSECEVYNNDDMNIMRYNYVQKLNTYFYPIDIEDRIINNVKIGNKDEVYKLLNEVRLENFSHRIISSFLADKLFYEISGTIHKILDKLNAVNQKEYDLIQSLTAKLDYKAGIQDFFTSIYQIFDKIFSYIEEINFNNRNKLINEILDYINKEFSNADLNSAYAAMHFKMSDAYFSQFFKTKTGIKFSNYLENLRIEYACKLLCEDNLAVNEIVEKVGYSGDQVFRRAFKRVKGVSPTDYKNCVKV